MICSWDGTATSCHYKGVYFKPGDFVPVPTGECKQMKCLDPATNTRIFLMYVYTKFSAFGWKQSILNNSVLGQ